MSERMCSKCALMPASVTHLCPPPDGRLAIWQDGYVHGETDGYEKGWERGAARALREAADEMPKRVFADWLRARAEQVNPQETPTRPERHYPKFGDATVCRCGLPANHMTVAEQVSGDEGHTHEFRNSDACTTCGKSMDNIRSSNQAEHDYECSCGMSFETFRGLRTHQGKSRRDGWDNPGTPKWAAHLTGGRRGPERGSGVAAGADEQVSGDEQG